jgi:hypothetical protein
MEVSKEGRDVILSEIVPKKDFSVSGVKKMFGFSF